MARADVRVRCCNGAEPLHIVAANKSNAQAATAVIRALLAAGADALARIGDGWTALRYALQYNRSQAAEALLAAMPTDAVLEDLCAADTPLARQLLPAFVASRLPLTDAQWALVPIAPIPGLARALPAALACSGYQARQLVRCLPRPMPSACAPPLCAWCECSAACRSCPSSTCPSPSWSASYALRLATQALHRVPFPHSSAAHSLSPSIKRLIRASCKVPSGSPPQRGLCNCRSAQRSERGLWKSVSISGGSAPRRWCSDNSFGGRGGGGGRRYEVRPAPSTTFQIPPPC